MLRLAIGQMEPKVNDREQNLLKLRSILDSATKQKVDTLILPESVNSGEVFKSKKELFMLSEEIPGGSFSKKLKLWSKKGGLVVAGLCEKTPEGVYNSAAIFGDGKHLATYRKIHLYGKEKSWFCSGNAEPPVIQHKGYKFGVIIGFDWAYPELTRILALRHAQVICHPANLFYKYGHKVMITRSIENRVFTATATRVGEERGSKFIGGSQITDPRGHILINMEEAEEGVVWIDIDPATADNKEIGDTDVMKDRRPELYGRITELQ
jgi:predicted amidohydrolase